ncbi:phage tail tape measure protein [Pseudovibrio exalbescens]|uniref:Phage tail protein n=1 Tax=Pseudovibrio exalbescens TaxID=197461 RepID=A0A1U7JEQ1_9HYPH|nr:phage tail tape measure protein [Pseudovibrio exalbescens]OKL43197.1 hypothetical protein A3843_15945 [Pseudovibrio exalbescens]
MDEEPATDWGVDQAEELAATFRDLKGLAGEFSRELTSGLSAAVLSGKSLRSVMSEMALSLSRSSLNAALQPLEAALTNGLTNLVSGSVSGSLSGVMPFAKGGIVAAPTYFPMGHNGAALGVMGEAGPEAVLPLKRGVGGRLGVDASGAAGAPITVNVTTPDVQGFQQSQGQVATAVARAVGRGQRGL